MQQHIRIDKENIMTFNLENYVEVKDRIPLFKKQFEDARITTQVIHQDADSITIMAFLWRDGIDQAANTPLATGIAKEKDGGYIDKYVENCETSAIGRALANYDILGDSSERPSREEMRSAQSMKQVKENRPAPSAPEPSAPAQSGEVASVKQINYLQKLGYQEDPTGLTMREASSLISELQEKQDQLSTSRR
tara:strand:+ start:725 stop:1303 length:579 start_codon:yes stop_codon:yes gene_type:complete